MLFIHRDPTGVNLLSIALLFVFTMANFLSYLYEPRQAFFCSSLFTIFPNVLRNIRENVTKQKWWLILLVIKIAGRWQEVITFENVYNYSSPKESFVYFRRFMTRNQPV